MKEFYSDRSRSLAYQTCPRLRYLQYEVPTGTAVGGVRPGRLDMNLVVGGAFHAGIQELLDYEEAKSNGHCSRTQLEIVEDSVGIALNGDATSDWPGYWPLVKSQGLIITEKEDAYYVYHEQGALIEALIRGYAAFVLPQLLDRFYIVEVEREEVGRFGDDKFTLVFGGRADALLMEKDSNDLYVLSLKTTKEWDKRLKDSGREDMQGMSETAIVEQRLKAWHDLLDSGQGLLAVPEWFIKRYSTGALPQIMGVKMEYAMKGRRAEEPYGSGVYKYSNPLIRPWKKADDLGDDRYAFKYEFKDEFGGNHRLGKGWNRVNIWEDIGVKKWIEILSTQSIQGFDPMLGISNSFILPEDYFRNQQDIDRWERGIVEQERRIAGAVEGINQARGGSQEVQENPSDTLGRVQNEIDRHFPLYGKSCNYPTACQFKGICYGPDSYLHDPLSAGFIPREPNHPTEVEN